jgi:hypothetical protein
MMTRRFLVLSVFIGMPALGLIACGGGNPVSSSAGGGIVLHGTVLGVAGVGASSLSVSTAAASLTVTVQEQPAISTTVADDGTFTLRGLPEGSFTLVFANGGVTLGTIAISGVQPNQEVTITVKVSSSTVTLVEERRNGIGHGDIEIEGLVSAVLALQPAGESRFVIDGKTVAARPGETAIREGNRARTASDVTVGRRVHVKGIWLPPDASGQAVLAHEIMLQGEREEAPEAPNTPNKACMIEGGHVGDRIELEGTVASGASANFSLKLQGNRSSGNVQVDGSSASFQCNGPKITPAECQASVKSGAKVHVSGTLASCDLTSALARASKVIVQK